MVFLIKVCTKKGYFKINFNIKSDEGKETFFG